MGIKDSDISIVLPAKNEAQSLEELLPSLCDQYPGAEVIVVDDGSDDGTAEVCLHHKVTVVRHMYSMGNGAAVKSGARHASRDCIVFMDADGQHDPVDIKRLLEKIDEGYDMAVGARKIDTHASWLRRVGNSMFNWLASIMTTYKVEDLTSGYRAVKAASFKRFLYLLPNKFSYPTTSTMAFFRSGFSVCYVPIKARDRSGQSKSHIRIFRDGFRFLMIILKIGVLFSPMRFFLPLSVLMFTIALSYYAYTYMSFGRFTNMGGILFLSSLFLFVMGVISEQISALHYRDIELKPEKKSSQES